MGSNDTVLASPGLPRAVAVEVLCLKEEERLKVRTRVEAIWAV
ncbi:hypothetical protein [Hyalangium sp.]|nr:hypothetical protein [Hyalangium sp.]HYI00932.1 hypothetical protein [Hyalangium sp.]